MYNLPPEIHSYICQLACVDDGRTVRALSLVSRYIREIARPFLYQSIALTGLENIAMAVSKIESTPHHLRHIRHLFISDKAVEKSKTGSTRPATGSDSANIIRLLTLAAPTLETLSFISTTPTTGTAAIARLFRLSFPYLRELTVSGYYPFLSSRTMSSLERLHLHGNRNPHGLLQMGGLDEACPSLTHLRVSGLSMAVSFALELQEALGNDHTSPFPSKLSPHVRNVVVQPGPVLPVSGKPTASHIKEQTMMDRLNAIKAPDGVRYEVLGRGDKDALYDSFRQSWLDRLDGAEGFWA